MSLYEDMMVPCVRLGKVMAPDGEGGFQAMWVEADGFEAAITRSSTVNARVAEKPATTETYMATVQRGFHLFFHDVFRRVSDGRTFRVTANSRDRQTPEVAMFDFERVTCEEWEIEE